MSELPPLQADYSIGEVSRLTGLSPHTIRVWERRYGQPVPKRLPSGHRRYARSAVELLQAASELTTYGYRPGKILDQPLKKLQALVTEERKTRGADQSEIIERALHAGGNDLRQQLQTSFREMGIRQSLNELVIPLLARIGQAWAEQTIDIHQEHILSEALEDVLRSTRMQLPVGKETDDGADLLLATLPGERHGLGLQLLALVASLEGSAPLILGVDLPLEEILQVSRQHPDAAVALSVSSAADVTTLTRQLQALRSILPRETKLLAGGAGMTRRPAIAGILSFQDLPSFEKWLQDEKRSKAANRDIR